MNRSVTSRPSFCDIPAIRYGHHHAVHLSAGADLREELIGGLRGLGDVDLVDAGEDLAVDEDGVTPKSSVVSMCREQAAGVAWACRWGT